MPIGFPADADTLRKHSTWFIVYGAVMVLLGLFAIAAPDIATLTVTLMVGWLLLLGGGFGLFAVISGGTSAPGFWWNLLTAIVYILAGLVGADAAARRRADTDHHPCGVSARRRRDADLPRGRLPRADSRRLGLGAAQRHHRHRALAHHHDADCRARRCGCWACWSASIS